MEDDDQTRKPPIPAPPIPDLAERRGRESPISDSESAGIGNREIPRFPIRPGPGIAVPVPGIGVPRAARRGFPGLRLPGKVPAHLKWRFLSTEALELAFTVGSGPAHAPPAPSEGGAGGLGIRTPIGVTLDRYAQIFGRTQRQGHSMSGRATSPMP